MSTKKVQQGIPVIIKGGSKSGIIAKAIEIDANSIFSVTQEFQSEPSEWTQSDSAFAISYVESVMVGEMGANLQFCQTSSMAHPLKYTFKDSDDNNIFTIQEASEGSNYSLQISVDSHGNYFQITQSAKGDDNWTTSTFNTLSIVVSVVEVTDVNNTPVCQFLVNDGENIYLNLEPPV